MEIRFVSSEELHRIASIKSLYYIRMSEEVRDDEDVYDIWMAKFHDREDLLMYVKRKSKRK